MSEEREELERSGGEAAQGGETAAEAVDVEALRRELEETKARAAEHWDQLLRARAELENLRRRMEREVEAARKYALEAFAKELLAVRDSLELGLSAAAEEGADIEKLREGTELTLKLLTGVMEKFGIREIDPQGERFDPERHQAMTSQPADHVEPNTVLNVFQKGYLLNDRLIRPALVSVSTGKGGAEGRPKVDEHA
ncbi:nucleotide exchange factor GrpE [Inmirania thermothiophila]|uniref:Protein GrpE n=1 Tax=Inmirania thermothiophila TaxID=1750597 RepID=A0A3N1Y0P7_9GAMM|nr:nucleotide exchange factor GrpE [Inmirania thermothiophila]ROR32078.1 molecular chaperone GrpE [Inmirania thermothiophila]